MARTSGIKEHMEVIGADGVHVGTVDKVEGDRLKLTRKDSGQGSHRGHHHYLPTSLVADVEGNRVRLSATGANAFMLQEEEDMGSARLVNRGEKQTARAPKSKSRNKGGGMPWGMIALGTAALAAAGAIFANRRTRTEDQDFELQLQTDENMRLISSTKVEGTPVYGRDGAKLGRIENFMVDKYTGRVGYAVLSFGGTFGLGESFFPLPWSLLTYDVDKDGYCLDLTAEDFADAPRFSKSDAPEFTADYRRNIGRVYRIRTF